MATVVTKPTLQLRGKEEIDEFCANALRIAEEFDSGKLKFEKRKPGKPGENPKIEFIANGSTGTPPGYFPRIIGKILGALENRDVLDRDDIQSAKDRALQWISITNGDAVQAIGLILDKALDESVSPRVGTAIMA